MKHVILVFAFTFLMLAVPLQMSAASQWYEGGGLQGAFVGQWNMATYTNKLATAAAWITIQPKIKDKAFYTRVIQKLRPQAFELVQCVDRSATVEGYYSRTIVDELAENCLLLLQW